jgi:ligand-binding sensor domain-containing protein
MNAQEYYKSLLYKVKYAFVTCYILVLLLPQEIAAQQYFIKSYAADNGLPTNIINDACQDKDGNMWFSTYFGISKYDGFSFNNFDTLNGLADQHYRKLRCDEKGILWAVPYDNKGKIVFLQDNSWKSIEFPRRRPPYSYITSFDVIYISNSPVICVGSYAGIDVYQNKNWQHYNISDEKSTNIVYSVTAKNTSFYIGTKAGLCVLNDEILDWSLNNKINTDHEAILAIKFEKPGLPWQRMWILTQHSVSYFQNNKLTPIAENFLLEDIDIAQFPFIGLRKNGSVIFGSNFSKYLLKLSDRQAIPLRINNGFSANGASSVFIDREENIWFTDSRGIDKISDLSVVNYFKTGGMPENEVTAIAETNDGRLVMGHNNRISILQDQKFKVIEFPGTKNNLTRVLDIMKDRDGNIWFSANNLGIGKLTSKNAIKWYKTEKGFLVSSVCQDLTGRIWFGTNRKLYYLEAEKIVEYEHNDMLNGSVRKIYTSNKGGIFVTGIGGLSHVDNGKVIKIKTVDENQDLNVFSYYKDKKGTEFVGTMNGLYYINDSIITRFTENGLRINNSIYFILQDRENFYWFGTNNGVYRWDGINDPELFNTFNGLAGRETNRSAGFLDSQGRVWVGTDRGLSCFLPGSDHFKTPAPLVRLFSIETLHGEKYPLNESVSISNTHNTFSFHFRGISFVNEELITYKYKLEGYDKDWREATQDMLSKIHFT